MDIERLAVIVMVGLDLPPARWRVDRHAAALARLRDQLASFDGSIGEHVCNGQQPTRRHLRGTFRQHPGNFVGSRGHGLSYRLGASLAMRPARRVTSASGMQAAERFSSFEPLQRCIPCYMQHTLCNGLASTANPLIYIPPFLKS